MKVLQLIDSLATGGAERMAVNLANLLSKQIEVSYLCSTRLEGPLKSSIFPEVEYLFLNRKKTIDLSAFKRLKAFVKKEGITHIHAHGTSFLIATWIKWRLPKVKLIWHEHHGNRITTGKRENRTLIFCSNYFDKIITVNEELKHWCIQYLKTKNVAYLPNFIPEQFFQNRETNYKEEVIVCVANLREPKDHLNLLNAFLKVKEKYPNWSLWLIGKDLEDSYSEKLKLFVHSHNLDSSVKFLGVQENISMWLSKAKIGILSSKSEGFPMTLLEYGAMGLGVISTNVGYCEQIVKGRGIVVNKEDSKALEKAILVYIEDVNKRESDGKYFQEYIYQNFSDKASLKQLLNIYSV